jgi:hypothetical protein
MTIIRFNTKITKDHQGPQNQNFLGAEAASEEKEQQATGSRQQATGNEPPDYSGFFRPKRILDLSSWPFVLLRELRVPSSGEA